MKRLFGYIVLMCCGLFAMLRLAGETEPSKTFHLDSFGFPVTEQVASQQEQHVALLQIIHASLCSDALPATPGVNGTRVETPVFRLGGSEFRPLQPRDKRNKILRIHVRCQRNQQKAAIWTRLYRQLWIYRQEEQMDRLDIRIKVC